MLHSIVYKKGVPKGVVREHTSKHYRELSNVEKFTASKLTSAALSGSYTEAMSAEAPTWITKRQLPKYAEMPHWFNLRSKGRSQTQPRKRLQEARYAEGCSGRYSSGHSAT
jgi:hypothetical protein